MCTKILACFFDLNNSKSSLLGQSPKMLIESLSQTHELRVATNFGKEGVVENKNSFRWIQKNLAHPCDQKQKF